MRAGLGIEALFRQTQPLDGLAAYQMLLHNLRGIRGLHRAIPDGFGIHHDSWSVFTLIKATGFVDAHLAAKACGLGELLQLREELTLAVGGAGRARRVSGAVILADKNMMLKCGQAVFLRGCESKSEWMMKAFMRLLPE